MTTFFLVRHASYPGIGKRFLGRRGSIGLDAAGREQSCKLANLFAGANLARVQSGPSVRTRQTAEPIAACAGVALEIIVALDEIDAGEWTGCSFEELQADPRWRHWNVARTAAPVPGGETIAAVRDRIVPHLESTARSNPDAAIAIVTHAEVIRTVLLHYLRRPFEDFAEIEIEPAGIAALGHRAGEAEVLALNIADATALRAALPAAAMEA